MHEVERSSITRARVCALGSIVFCGVFPAIVVAMLFATAINDDSVAEDFQQFYRAAVGDPARRTAYPEPARCPRPWGGPTLSAAPGVVTTPFTALPLNAAGLLVMALLVRVALAIPFVLGVRDWRCYGLALLWPPVISAIQTGNITLWLALAAALRGGTATGSSRRPQHRSHARREAVPLAARRLARGDETDCERCRRACAMGVALLITSWAVIGFDGFLDTRIFCAGSTRRLGEDSYTRLHRRTRCRAAFAGRAAALAGLRPRRAGGVVVIARRGDERTAFVLALRLLSR